MRDLEDQIDVFPREMVLRRIDAERNMWRFYRLAVEPDLFGGASLVRQWGRIGRPGQQLSEAHADEGLAINALLRLAAAKLKRGYRS